MQVIKQWTKIILWTAVLLALQVTALAQVCVLGTALWLVPALFGTMLSVRSGGLGTVLYALMLGSWADAMLGSGWLFTLLYPALAVIVWRLDFELGSIMLALVISVSVSILGSFLHGLFFVLMPGRGGVAWLWLVMPMEVAWTIIAAAVVWVLMRERNREPRRRGGVLRAG